MADKQAQHAVTDVQVEVYAYQYNVCRKLLHISSSGTVMQQTIYMVKAHCKTSKEFSIILNCNEGVKV
jgi:hypothetical protein